MNATHIDVLRRSGWDDGEILEIAQVVGMFSYFVRIINATGISLTGDKIGLY
jgi:alkylhydroperoxidase family enzyme